MDRLQTHSTDLPPAVRAQALQLVEQWRAAYEAGRTPRNVILEALDKLMLPYLD